MTACAGKISNDMCVRREGKYVGRVESVELPRRDGYHQRQDARNMGRRADGVSSKQTCASVIM